MAYEVVRAACKELEKKLGSGNVSGRFIAESYSLVREFTAQVELHKAAQNREAVNMTLVDDLALGLYMTAVVQEEIRNCVTPDIIQSFRGAVLRVLRAWPPQSF